MNASTKLDPQQPINYDMPCSICVTDWSADEPWHWCPVCGKPLTPKATIPVPLGRSIA
jgi:rRNA maturation endonuclease Nob1